MGERLQAVLGDGGGGDPREEKARYWRDRLAAWKRSGESQAEFCRLHNLRTHRFTYWKRRITEEGNESLDLVEVPRAMVPSPEPRYSAAPALVIEVGRYRVELASDFCPRAFSSVLDELERRR